MSLAFSGLTSCSICANPLSSGDDVVGTTHFISDSNHPLWRYSDSTMHKTCFLSWPHKKEFIELHNKVMNSPSLAEHKRRRLLEDGRTVLAKNEISKRKLSEEKVATRFLSMKYLLAGLGMLIGQLIGEFIADSRILNWTLGFILGGVSYELPTLVRYLRGTPKQLLAFHGPDAPISKSRSPGELRTFLSQLHKGGLLLSFVPHGSEVKVDETQWVKLQYSEKLTLFQVLAQAQIVDAVSAPEIRLFSKNGALLATYSTIEKTIEPNDGSA